jgi:hypothetical protein
MVDKKRSQHINFAHEALPIIFNTQYAGFMQYLEKDRTKFLEFWWKHIGDQLDKSLCKAPNGLNYQIIDIDEKRKIVLITLPPPDQVGEAYFLACVKLPDKKVPFVSITSTRVISLFKSVDDKGRECTRMAYLTRTARMVPIGIGPPPDADIFLAEVRKILKLKI